MQKRVLVVDDDRHILQLLLMVLEEDYEVLGARDGIEALELAASARPDLVLTDVTMPRLDGVSLIRLLRAEPEMRQVPMFLMSARRPLESVEADGFLPKPFNLDDLEQAIEEALRGGQSSVAAR